VWQKGNNVKMNVKTFYYDVLGVNWIVIGSGDFSGFFWRCDPTRVMASSFLRFLDHTQ